MQPLVSNDSCEGSASIFSPVWHHSTTGHRTLGVWRRLVDTIPGVCAICGGWPAQTFCRVCVNRFAPDEPRCQCCAARLHPSASSVCGGCRLQPPPLDRCIAAVAWGWPWRDFIARFKFGRDPGWARPLAGLVAANAGADAALSGVDLIVPVPLSKARLRERGFNQSLLLARCLDRSKTDADVLHRVRHVEPQATLDRAARLTNLRGAFALGSNGAARVRGQHVALVDDVMTTGATLFEAAQVLRLAGAAQITALVLARNDDAPAHGTQPVAGAMPDLRTPLNA